MGLTSVSLHSGLLTLSSFLFVKALKRPRSVDSASVKPPSRRTSRYDLPASLDRMRKSSMTARSSGAGFEPVRGPVGSGVEVRVLRRRVAAMGLAGRESLRGFLGLPWAGLPGVLGETAAPGDMGGEAARSGLSEGAKRRSSGEAVAHWSVQQGRSEGRGMVKSSCFTSGSSRFMR